MAVRPAKSSVFVGGGGRRSKDSFMQCVTISMFSSDMARFTLHIQVESCGPGFQNASLPMNSQEEGCASQTLPTDDQGEGCQSVCPPAPYNWENTLESFLRGDELPASWDLRSLCPPFLLRRSRAQGPVTTAFNPASRDVRLIQTFPSEHHICETLAPEPDSCNDPSQTRCDHPQECEHMFITCLSTSEALAS